jgi:uncharacterized protein YdhG (YjbR/CyaY superfamily)
MTVDEYLEKQKSPQKEICQLLRDIIFKTFPTIKEEMKWGVPTCAEDKYYFVALKNHVNLGFSIVNLSTEELQEFERSCKTMRVISINSMNEINEDKIVELLKLVWTKQNA